MKRIAIFCIIFGFLCFFGAIIISAFSLTISENLKTIGFIALCYLSVISFTYGWIKIHNINKDKEKK